MRNVDGQPVPVLSSAPPQRFESNGHTWTIGMRPERRYHPFSVTLLELRHDVYAGTSIPKNYSSRVRVASDDGREAHETLIYMNSPMRYGGLTFYQYQMNSPEHYTVLQVVRNPSWVMPYIACSLITLGLIVQFGIHLIGFAGKRRALAASAASAA
jgi:cytochrome c biogenesis protein ResB